MTGLRPREEAALAAIDEAGLVACLRDLVANPSLTGTPAQSEAQHRFAARMEEAGLAVDLGQIYPDATRADPESPGLEPPRDDAWRPVGRRGGREGPTPILRPSPGGPPP